MFLLLPFKTAHVIKDTTLKNSQGHNRRRKTEFQQFQSTIISIMQHKEIHFGGIKFFFTFRRFNFSFLKQFRFHSVFLAQRKPTPLFRRFNHATGAEIKLKSVDFG